MKKIVLIVLALCLLSVPQAGATVIVAPEGTLYQQWTEEAREPTPPISIEVIADSSECGGPNACTNVEAPIWITPFGNLTEQRWTWLHELGHQFDYSLMNELSRNRFEELIGDFRDWKADPNGPNEKFAEAYALCSLRNKLKRTTRFGYKYEPTPIIHAKVCHLIRVTGEE